ncbi:hypothetical protein ES703_32288 [subsurface metagenome]
MIKTLNVTLGQIGVAQQNPLGIAVPGVAPGVYATGYYTDPATGQVYYYNASLEQWYYLAAGLYYPLGISWQPSPSPIINLGAGDTLRFLMSFKFSGPLPVTQVFKAFIGNNTKEGGFGEWDNFWATKEWVIPSSDLPVLHTNYYVDLVIPSGHEGEDGAAYLKKDQFFIEEGKDSTPYYYDVCHIIPAEGEFTELKISKFEKV